MGIDMIISISQALFDSSLLLYCCAQFAMCVCAFLFGLVCHFCVGITDELKLSNC